MVHPLWRTAWRFLIKLKIELPYDPQIPFLGIYLEKNMIQRGTCSPTFIAALFKKAKTWKQLKCPSAEEWIKKLWYIYTTECYSAIKGNEIMPFAATWMDLNSVIKNQDREGEISYDITSIWNLKRNVTNELTYKTERYAQT